MFPYTCLATMPLFCYVDWPKKFEKWCKSKMREFNFRPTFKKIRNLTDNSDCRKKRDDQNNDNESKNKEQNKDFENSPSLNFSNENIVDSSQEIDNDFTLEKGETASLKKEEEGMKNFASCLKNLHEDKVKKVSKKQKFVVSLLLLHIGLQFFLPYSHFITKVNYICK